MSDTPVERFDIRFSPRIRWLLRGFGMGPARSGVLLAADSLQARVGSFRVETPRSVITAVSEVRAPWWAVAGVHTDLRGRWIINGGPGSLVRLELAQPVTASVGRLHVRLRRLDVGLTDNARLARMLGDGPGTPR